MSLEFTLVRRAIRLAAIDGPDAGDNPDILQAQGSVLFEPVIRKGDSIQVQTRDGSETYALAPIECPINDGIISHRGQDGVKLPAGGEAANPPLIRWKATFSRMQAGGKSFTLAPVIFDAVPGGEIDLTMVAPVAGAPEGVVRGPRGTSLESIIVDGSELVFTAVDDAGSFEIARIPLDDMVRAEADAAAAAAVDGVETVLAATVDAANAARDDAKGHASRAESAATTAAGETSALVRSEFEGMLTGAESARDAAGVSETNAAQSENDAAGYADLAEQYKTAAGLARDDAAQSKADAALSASSADGDAAAAAASASSAAQSESSAATHAQSALGYAGQAEDARDESRLARDEAVQAAENAQQGAPSDGWKKNELSQQVQDSLSRADTALQSMPVATEQAPGAIRLSGDLGGTAQAPTVPGLAGKADAVHTHSSSQVDGLDAALARLGNIRAWFRGEGPPPASIPGAQVGDWWLDTTTMELHEITEV